MGPRPSLYSLGRRPTSGWIFESQEKFLDPKQGHSNKDNGGRHDFFAFVGAPDEWMKEGKKAIDAGAVKLLSSAAFLVQTMFTTPMLTDSIF